MDLAEAEQLLLERLGSARSIEQNQTRALDGSLPASLADVAAVGIDTNVLKALRRDTNLADRLFVTLQANQTSLIAPAQCVIEYWNNHRVFAQDDWNRMKSDLQKLKGHITADGIAGHDERRVQEIERLIGEVAADLEATRDPAYLSKSKQLIRSLLEAGTMPMVSRIKFAELGRIRLASKYPPGFADEKEKGASSLGDFYVWCDFLLGVLGSTDSRGRENFLWVTDDLKPDWRTGDAGHPMLLAEFDWVCGKNLSMLEFASLRKLLAEDTDARSEAGVPDTAPVVEERG